MKVLSEKQKLVDEGWLVVDDDRAADYERFLRLLAERRASNTLATPAPRTPDAPVPSKD